MPQQATSLTPLRFSQRRVAGRRAVSLLRITMVPTHFDASVTVREMAKGKAEAKKGGKKWTLTVQAKGEMTVKEFILKTIEINNEEIRKKEKERDLAKGKAESQESSENKREKLTSSTEKEKGKIREREKERMKRIDSEKEKKRHTRRTSCVRKTRTGPLLLTDNLKAYSLRIADDSGHIDDDFPILEEGQLLKDLLSKEFVLLIDPILAVREKQQEKPQEKPQEKRQELFCVYLSKSKDTNKILLRYEPNLTVAEVIGTVFKNRGIEDLGSTEHWSLCDRRTNTTFVPEATLEETCSREFLLLPKSRQATNYIEQERKKVKNETEGDAPSKITQLLSPLSFLTPESAAEYKVILFA